MTRRPFDFLPLPAARSAEKPRRTGLTMMIDMGLPPALVADHLRVVGPFVDIAKIFVGSARLYEEAVFREKAAIYGEHGVDLFIGGQFAEYAFYHSGMAAMPRFFQEVARLGVKAVEVSDNCVPLSDEERRSLIRMGLDAGLEVHGEVGSKETKADINDLIRLATLCLQAGCDMVLFEAAELVEAGAVDKATLERIGDALAPEQVMIELPGPWIKDVTLNDVYEMMKYVVATFGPDANLGNVAWDQVMNLETLRCGIGIAGPGKTAAQ
ncbi:phosphosulfolactate synthase [Pelagibius sp. 7325]|uniref:phosphosulfolactate synthase n=1 Tax=Pelagibius sp. 7325 TaxID=3131994 RepID=UPI0030EEA359